MAPLEDVHRGLHRELLQRNPVGHGVLHARLDGEGGPVHGSAEVGEVEPLPSLCRHQPWLCGSARTGTPTPPSSRPSSLDAGWDS